MAFNPKFYIIGIVVSIIIFSLMFIYVWNFTVDDAFISFNYGLHLANGFGLVWNIGQPPTEGYTNFLWVLIIACLFLLKLDPVISTKLISLFSVVVIIILFWFISNDIFENQENRYITFSVSTIFFLINPLTAIHTVSGLETMTYAFLLLGVVYVAWKTILSPNSKFIWLFAFLALLLSLLRPEGILISLGLILSIIYVFYRNNKSIKINSLLPVLILYLLTILINMIFTFSYFHELLPLSFLVKTIHGNSFSTISELLFALTYIASFMLIILISLFTRYQRTESQNIKQNYKYFLFTLILAVILADIVYMFTELIMNYGQRFFYPSFVLLYIAFGIAISIILNEINNNVNKKLLKNTTRMILYSFIVLLLLIPDSSFLTDLNNAHDYGNSLNQANIALGKALTQFSKDDYTVASSDAGAITYFSRWNQLDMDGLNDKFIADHGVAPITYVETKNPELVILATYGNPSDIVVGSYDQPFYNFVLEKNYIKLDPIKFNDFYYLIPFLNPNIKDFNSIKNSLENVSKESNS